MDLVYLTNDNGKQSENMYQEMYWNSADFTKDNPLWFESGGFIYYIFKGRPLSPKVEEVIQGLEC